MSGGDFLAHQLAFACTETAIRCLTITAGLSLSASAGGRPLRRNANNLLHSKLSYYAIILFSALH